MAKALTIALEVQSHLHYAVNLQLVSTACGQTTPQAQRCVRHVADKIIPSLTLYFR